MHFTTVYISLAQKYTMAANKLPIHWEHPLAYICTPFVRISINILFMWRANLLP